MEKFISSPTTLGFTRISSISNHEMQRDIYISETPNIQTKAVVTQKPDGTITVNAQTHEPNKGRETKDSFMHFVKSNAKNPDWIWATPQKDQSFRALHGNPSIARLASRFNFDDTEEKDFAYLSKALDTVRQLQRAARERQATKLPVDVFRHAVQTKKPKLALEALEQGARISSRDPGGKNIATRLNTYSQDPDAQRWLGRKMINAITKILRERPIKRKDLNK